MEAPTAEAKIGGDIADSISESLSRKSKESNTEAESSNCERNGQGEQSSRQALEQDEIEFAYEDIDGQNKRIVMSAFGSNLEGEKMFGIDSPLEKAVIDSEDDEE